jgi:hypothetical protein
MLIDKSDLRDKDLEEIAPICPCGKAVSGYSESAVVIINSDYLYRSRAVVYCCDKCADSHIEGVEQLGLYPDGSISKLV